LLGRYRACLPAQDYPRTMGRSLATIRECLQLVQVSPSFRILCNFRFFSFSEAETFTKFILDGFNLHLIFLFECLNLQESDDDRGEPIGEDGSSGDGYDSDESETTGIIFFLIFFISLCDAFFSFPLDSSFITRHRICMVPWSRRGEAHFRRRGTFKEYVLANSLAGL